MGCVESKPSIEIELVDRLAVEATRRGMIEVRSGHQIPGPCKAYLIPKLELNVLSCIWWDEYGIWTTFAKRGCNFGDTRNNREVFGMIKRKESDKLFTAKLFISKQRDKINFTETKADADKSNDEESSNMGCEGAKDLWHRDMVYTSPSLVKDMTRLN